MMNACKLLISCAVTSSVFFASLAATAGEARRTPPEPVPGEDGRLKTGAAEVDPAKPTSNPWAASGTTAERPTGSVVEGGRRSFAIAANPLGVLIGRYSLQAEYLPVAHHAFTLSPFFTHVPVTFTSDGRELDAGSLTGFGGELGYRFYTSRKGPAGFFVGPSLLFASYSASAPSGSQPSGSEGSGSFLAYGGAIDLGGQAVVGPGVVIGGGFGLQYTKNSEPLDGDNLNLASAIIASGGIRPRFLFTVGYAF